MHSLRGEGASQHSVEMAQLMSHHEASMLGSRLCWSAFWPVSGTKARTGARTPIYVAQVGRLFPLKRDSGELGGERRMLVPVRRDSSLDWGWIAKAHALGHQCSVSARARCRPTQFGTEPALSPCSHPCSGSHVCRLAQEVFKVSALAHQAAAR